MPTINIVYLGDKGYRLYEHGGTPEDNDNQWAICHGGYNWRLVDGCFDHTWLIGGTSDLADVLKLARSCTSLKQLGRLMGATDEELAIAAIPDDEPEWDAAYVAACSAVFS